jgi:aryl-alcohol dehydrogenase-like predicted oxidoreductase
MNMYQRSFGRTNLPVSELCLSTSNFARYSDQAQSFALLDAFRAAGGNFIQTSGTCPGAVCGQVGLPGLPEEFVGRWRALRGIPRHELVIATRFRFARPVLEGERRYRALMLACVHDSLRRLGTDYLDFLVLEWSNALIPLNETLAAIEAMMASGAARQVILADFPAEYLDVARRSAGAAMAGVQLDYSLIYRSRFESGAAAFCREHGFGFIARSPLAGGYLVARPPPDPGSFCSRVPNGASLAQAALSVRPALRSVARTRGILPVQAALAWVLSRPGVSSALIGMRSPAQLHELLGAIGHRLSLRELHQLETAAAAPAPTTAEAAPSVHPALALHEKA